MTAGLLLLVLEPAAAATSSRLLPGFIRVGFSRVAPAADGGSFAAGQGSGPWMDWLIKLDAAGEPLWSVSFEAYLRDLVPTADGGVLVAGAYLQDAGPDGTRPEGTRLLRFDAMGGLVWQRSYELKGPTRCTATPDGGFACTGLVIAGPSYAYDTYLLEVDADGNTELLNLYGDDGPFDDALVDVWWNPVVPGYVLAGKSLGHCLIAQLDESGNVLSAMEVGAAGSWEEGCRWSPAPDGGSFLSFETTPGPDSMVMASLDAAGSILWQIELLDRSSAYAHAMPDGGLIAASSFGRGALWAARLDATDVLWERRIEGELRHTAIHPGGDLMIVGSRPFASEDMTAWLFKLDPSGTIDPSCPLVEMATTTVLAYAATGRSGTLAMRPGTVTELPSEAAVAPLTESLLDACPGAAGCACTAPVRNLLLVKTADSVRLTWDATGDPCHARYKVYSSGVPGMRPSVEPGTWPTDPRFLNTTHNDWDGSASNLGYERGPRYAGESDTLYYQVVGICSDGLEGPVGSFGK